MKVCKFCKCQADHKPLETVQDYIDIYYCYPCNTEYLFFIESDELWGYSIYTYINNSLYRWSNSGMGNGIWHIEKPGVPGKSKNEGMTLVKAFRQDPLPDINPENINSKIKTWLPFL